MKDSHSEEETFNKLSLFEKNILGKNTHSLIGKYLSIKDNFSFIAVTNNINNNNENKICFNHLIKTIAQKIIFRFMIKIKKFLEMVTEEIYLNMITSKTLTKRYLALFYFKFYDKRLINLWYNHELPIKKSIIDTYKIKITDFPSKFDFFNLIKKIPICDVFYIGW